ncbi:MAG TPA: peptidase T [Bacteroidales bacterium]|nr:peptidase T [Bacteroidales bacterium]HPT11632.1 peptidase T [Bacteroidales bacterium]
MKNLLDRFMGYVRNDTMPDEESSTCPSTERQLRFAEKIAGELRSIGMTEVCLDSNGYVMATLPATDDKNSTVIGFIAHMDTSPEAPSANVRPLIHEKYNGNDIILNAEKNITLSVNDFPEIKNYKGQTIITSDGLTLLGADDKAGIAEIVTAMETLIKHHELSHGKIRVGFTPDEEIGRGADKFDVAAFGADYAYTVDGGEIGELEYENFNAASAVIKIGGRNVHPGTAKGQMINSILLSQRVNSLLPENEKPEFTTGHEGFFHLFDIRGSVEETTMKYIIRDHDLERFNLRKKQIEDAASKVRSENNGAQIDVVIRDQYYNMKEIIENHYHIIEKAITAFRQAGVEPKIKPVRGGTDGARLSYMGLPCPNIFTGGHNYHGRFEYIPLESMSKAVEVIINISTAKER